MSTSTWRVLSLIAVLTLASAGCSADAVPTPIPTDPTQPSLPGQPASVASLTVSPASDTVMVGKTIQLSATAMDSHGRPMSHVTVTWTSDDSSVATVSSTGLVTTVGVGNATVKATSGTAAGASAIHVLSSGSTDSSGTASDSSTANDWTFCSSAGTVCEFIGLRDVRLSGPSGAYVEQIAYHQVPCATYGFGGQNPAPGKQLHCDYGPLMTATVTNPMPGMAGLAAQVTVPMGSPGSPGPLLAPTNETGVYTDGSGSFRTTCSVAKFAFDDPIVYPGKPGASHLHEFFGNTSVGAFTTSENITTEGNSTCRGGILNRTAYWTPAVFDTRTGQVQTPDEGVFYYKTGYNIDPKVVQPMPAGLRMIAGNMMATGPQQYVTWGCRDSGAGSSSGRIPTNCPVGDAIRLTVIFPQCWDGVNLDSPDHKSHMSYPDYRNPPQRSTCPASHPVTLPEVTEHFDYPITASSTPQYWRLSSDMTDMTLPGGLSAHADWMMGWDATTMKTIATQCLNKAVDCGVGSIGNGTTLYY